MRKNCENKQRIILDGILIENGSTHCEVISNEIKNLDCLIMSDVPGNKKRSHSDSMLHDSLVTDIKFCSANSQYFDSNKNECISVIPDVPIVSTQILGYNFCKWVSVPSSNRDDCTNFSENSKFKSAPNKCLKLTNLSPNSPKKSPKDYWLLKHSSTHGHSMMSDERGVFTFDVDTKTFGPELEIPRRTLSTIMDNSPEDNDTHPNVIGCEVKLSNEMQCLKHKKYLQNKYQQQFSSSMESDDVFFETMDIYHETRKIDSSSDCIMYHKFDSKIRSVDKIKTDNSILDCQIDVPLNRLSRDPSFSKSSILSPSVLGLITPSPRIIDKSSPITISLENFVLSSNASVSYNSCDSKEKYQELSKRDKESVVKCDSLNISPKKSETNLTECRKSLSCMVFDYKKCNSDPNTAKCATINEDFFCKVSMKLKNENTSLIKNDKLEKNQLNLLPISNNLSPLPQTARKSICPKSPFPSDQLVCYSSAPDLLKDNSVCDGGKNHICQICDRTFSRSDMLSRHMRLHTGQRPYECRTCGQVFSRSDHLQTHLRTHTGEKPYRCSQCLYAAPRRDMVTRHMRVHARGKTRKGKKEMDVESPPPSPFNSHIIIDEKYFTRSRPSSNYHKEIPQISMMSFKKESTCLRQVALSNIDDHKNSDITIQAQSFNLKLNDHKAFDITQVLSMDNTNSECSRGSDDISEHPLPLDLSIQLQLNDCQLKSTQQLLVPYPSITDMKSLKKKNRKWSLADISTVKCVNVHDDKQISLSATCSPMTRSDSTMSVDSGVSYATPSSLIHSICSPGHISSDSPDIYTPGHVGEPTFFLWPTVDN